MGDSTPVGDSVGAVSWIVAGLVCVSCEALLDTRGGKRCGDPRLPPWEGLRGVFCCVKLVGAGGGWRRVYFGVAVGYIVSNACLACFCGWCKVVDGVRGCSSLPRAPRLQIECTSRPRRV